MTMNTDGTDSIDLTTLGAVKSWLEIDDTNKEPDTDIQDVITGFSQYVLNQCGVVSFSSLSAFVETRDGNGNDTMFTRNRPIVNVSAVVVNGVQVPPAGDWPSYGYYVADDKKSIRIRGTGPVSGSRSMFGGLYSPRSSFFRSRGFDVGQANVTLSYLAGFIKVPADLELRCRQACAINYRRRQTLDMASKSVSAGGTTGTTRFRDWEIPPECQTVIDFYSRLAVVG